MVHYEQFPWNAVVMKKKTHGPVDVISNYKGIHSWKISLLVGSVNVQAALLESETCWTTVAFARFEMWTVVLSWRYRLRQALAIFTLTDFLILLLSTASW